MDRPVIVNLHVEGFGESADTNLEVTRAEWDRMSPIERSDLLDEEAEAFAANHVGWGWHIADEDDAAAAGQP